MKKTTKKKVAKKVPLSRYAANPKNPETLNKNVAKIWVKALRSGDFEQTTGSLCRRTNKEGEYSHCCLGVLCEVLIDKIPLVRTKDLAYRFKNKKSSGTIDSKLQSFIGLSDDLHSTLISMNDTHNKSFKQIARYIETHE